MLIEKGKKVVFVMKDGPQVRPPAKAAMLHDPTGRLWKKNSILVCDYERAIRDATDDERKGWPKDYLGYSYDARVGRVRLPPKALGPWTKVGEVEEIKYVRGGTKRPGGYHHPFNKGSSFAVFVKGKKAVTLYKYGSCYRLEMPPGAILDARGIVWP